MSIVSSIVRRPVTAMIAVVLLAAFSVFTVSRLSVNFFPDVEFSEVTVFTSYTGASPEEIEENITKPLEEGIRGITNLDSVNSRSRSGSSQITIAFKYGTGLDQNVNNLRERIDRVKDLLPDGATDPLIFRFSGNDIPVVTLSMTSNRDLNDARQYFDDRLLAYFEQVDGVASVFVDGGDTKKVFVEPTINRLNAYGLTLEEIRGAIASNGQRTSLGYVKTEVSDIAITVESKYQNIEELRNLIVAQRTSDSGVPYYVRLRDVANIRLGYDTSSIISLFDEKPSLTISILKTSNANIIDVSNRVRLMLKQMENIAPKDFQFTITDDNSEFIKDSMSAVGQAVGSGGILAILVLLLFLRNITSVLIIAVSMPLSILFTLMLMYFFGLTLNFMSLAGLTLGIGMLVDNSIVVLEHIYNKRLRGVKLMPAAEFGATEMARPILASTLTTVLVFAPLLLFKNALGTMGGFFSELSFTVVVSVLASYVMAAFFVPVLASKYLPLYRARYKGIFLTINKMFERFFIGLEHFYQRSLHYVLKRSKRFILLIVIIAFLPLLLVPSVGFSFIPNFAPPAIAVRMTFPPTMKLAEMHEYQKEFAQKTNGILESFGVKVAHTQVTVTGREGGGSGDFFGGNSSNVAEYTLYYDGDVNSDTHDKIVAAYLPYLNIYPGVRIRAAAPRGGGGRNASSAAGFSLELKSSDYEKLRQTSALYKNLIEENFSGKLTNIDDNQPRSTLEYEIAVDKTLANSYGISIASLASELTTAVQGRNANKFKEGASEYNILLRLSEEDRKNSDVAERLYINTNKGERIPLSNLLDRSFALGTSQIRRVDFQRTITITGDLVDGYTSTQAVADVRSLLETYPRDEDVNYIFTGEFSEINDQFRILIMVFILAVLFVYGIMASQFESFLDPFIIVFTVPLTFSGVILIYFATKNQISSFTLVGMVMLVGIAVNHGIVMVDYINLLRKRGMGLLEALLGAAESRLQPILMTSATTILGLMPIVVLDINGVELIKPLALTVVGGLGASALLSLYFVPLMYLRFHRRSQKTRERRMIRLARREAYNIAGSRDYDLEHSNVINKKSQTSTQTLRSLSNNSGDENNWPKR